MEPKAVKTQRPDQAAGGNGFKKPASLETRQVEDLLAQMTLDEKIGQMTQVEKNSLRPGAVQEFFLGSVLSGGGGYPPGNSAAGWAEMVSAFHVKRWRRGWESRSCTGWMRCTGTTTCTGR
jgi:hypothetical protein